MGRSVFLLVLRQLNTALQPAFYTFNALVVRPMFMGKETKMPMWQIVLLSVLAAPFSFFATLYYEDWCRRRRARAAGAELPPMVPYRLPGGLDILLSMAMNAEKHYLGENVITTSRENPPALVMYTMFEHRIFTSEPAYLKSILAADFDSFEKGAVNQMQMDSLFGIGVFNSDGDAWKFHRSMSRPFFSRDRITHFDIFNRHVDDSLAQAKSRLKEGYAIDFQDLVSRFTLDSATEFLFGHDVKSLSAGLPYPSIPGAPIRHADLQHPANVFARAFIDAQIEIAKRVRYGGLWTLLEISGDKTKKSMETIDAFIEPIIADAIKKAKAEKNRDVEPGSENTDTLLDHLVKLTDDRKLIRDETLNIAIAGRDTTAATLTFVAYMLSQHPEVMNRLHQEIQAKLPDGQRPTFDDMKEMRYLRAVINETLRLYPPVPFNIRCATKDTVWPATKPGEKPLFVPKGMRCIFSPYIMHRRKDLWGEDALEFDPDRFLDERLHKYLVPNPFIYLPFSGGPRICLGQQFAYNEISFMLVRLVQEFSRIELAPDAQPADSHPPPEWAAGPGRKAVEKIKFKSHVTMYSVGGLWVKMEERK